jgi:hypothetical protein
VTVAVPLNEPSVSRLNVSGVERPALTAGAAGLTRRLKSAGAAWTTTVTLTVWLIVVEPPPAAVTVTGIVAADALADAVNVTSTEPPAGGNVYVEGEAKTSGLDGIVIVTGALKPPPGVTVNVIFPALPGVRVSEGGTAVSMKSGAPVTRIETGTSFAAPRLDAKWIVAG